ncbi:right-handed parallel beta-helix repeat-containing protein [Methanobrevibacter filiformis]|uniref:Bacterial Ig-like domain protein n=1 Tax=Methanobrevibacter filiformis TaxID=55758 RepID=A0A166EV02_9EURY|nr:right-handed parallel beta-helix repeat-containing protein [Methanobrevibacter filiformis]KZX17042.1 hypothetical protein MBFIL_03930 [Methanobrevibacter filiformis]
MKSFFKINTRFLLITLSILIAATISISGASATVYDIGDGDSIQSIQNKIDSSVDGDTINFKGVVYNNVNLAVNKSLNLKSDVGTTFKATSKLNDTSASSKYVLDNQANASSKYAAAIYLVEGSSKTNISGFNFVGTYADEDSTFIYGGQKISDITIANNNFTGNGIFTAVNFYGGTSSNGSSSISRLLVENNTFKDFNTSGGNNGAIYFRGVNNLIFAHNSVFNITGNAVQARDVSDSKYLYNNFTNVQGGGSRSGISRVGANGVVDHNIFDACDFGIWVNNAGVNATYNEFKNGITAGIDGSKLDNCSFNLFLNLPAGFNKQTDDQTALYDYGEGNVFYNVIKNVVENTHHGDPLQPANLTISSELSSNSVEQNKNLTYIIKLLNSGNFSAKNIAIKVNIPAGLEVVYNYPSNGNFDIEDNYWYISSLTENTESVLTLTLNALTSGDNYILNASGDYDKGLLIQNITSTEDSLSYLNVTNASTDINNTNNSTNSGDVVKPKTATKIVVSKANGKYSKNVKLTAKLTDNSGKGISNEYVEFYINGKSIGIGKTDSTGYAYLNYNVTKTGKLNITTKFIGDSKYTAINNSNILSVPKYAGITIENIKEGSGKTVKFHVIVKNSGPDKASFKVSLKIPSGFKFTKITKKNSAMKVEYNKKTRTATFTLKSFGVTKKHTTSMVITTKANKTGSYSFKPKVTTPKGLYILSNNKVTYKVK